MVSINHLPFIVGSYAAAAIVVAGLIAWVMLDFRAQRRALELIQRGEKADYQAILADILRRDARDSCRAAAPLRPADDAEIGRAHV